jgi:hypothetical protein
MLPRISRNALKRSVVTSVRWPPCEDVRNAFNTS